MASEGKFLEIEKRKAAFKYVFNILQTSADNDPDTEQFSTSHQIYSDELINGPVNKSTSGDPRNNENTVVPARVRTWVTGSAGTNNVYDDIWEGSFSESIYDVTGVNPNVEKIIMPLIKLSYVNHQMYFAYDPIDYTQEFGIDYEKTGEYDRTLNTGIAFNNESQRLKNWINPTKFGSGYRIKIVKGDSSIIGNPSLNDTIEEASSKNEDGNSYGGWLFDYFQGALYFGLDIDAETTGDQVDLQNSEHPLWIVGYRYFGPTGSNMTVATASYALNACLLYTSPSPRD